MVKCCEVRCGFAAIHCDVRLCKARNMCVKLLERRSHIIDLENAIRELEGDIRFYNGATFPEVYIEDAKKG